MRQKRRKFVKYSIGSLCIPLFSGIASARQETRVSIRRDKSNPISVSELDEVRESFVDDVLSAKDAPSKFALAEQTSFETTERKIVAYNLEMVNGAPREFIGTISSNQNGGRVRMHDENGPVRAADEVSSLSEEAMVSNVHQVADEDQRDAQSESQMPTTSGNDPDNWEDWEQMSKSKSHSERSTGNTFGWTVNFKNNPEDGTVYAIETEGRMDPAANNHEADEYWRNRKTEFKHDWKSHSTVESDMFDHEPQNQTSVQEWQVAANIGLTPSVTIGTSGSVGDDGVKIADRSSPDRGEYAEARFAYNNQANTEQYEEVNSVSVAKVDQEYDQHPPTVVDIDLRGVFDSPHLPWENSYDRFEESFRYNIFGN